MKKRKPRRKYLQPVGSKACPPEYLHMDAGIRKTVQILVEGGIETLQSCQGGPGHCYPEPIVEFGGGYAAGYLALSIAITHGFRIDELRRVWSMQDGEPVGPHWAMTFRGLPVSDHG